MAVPLVHVNLTPFCILPGKCHADYKSFSRSLSILPCILHMFHPSMLHVYSGYETIQYIPMEMLHIHTCILQITINNVDFNLYIQF